MTVTTGFQSANGIHAAPGNGAQSTYTVNYPAGVAAGDLLIAIFCHDELGYSGLGQPTVIADGWTTIASKLSQDPNNSAVYGGIYVMTRIAGSETSIVFKEYFAQIGGTASFNSDGMAAAVLNYGNAGSQFDGTPQLAITEQSGSTYPQTITAPSMTPQYASDLLIAVFFAVPTSSSAAFSNPPGGMTSRFTLAPGGTAYSGLAVYDQQLSSATATPIETLTISPSAEWVMGGQILLSYGSAPAMPSLTSPAAGSSLDSTNGVTLTGIYNSTDGTAQAAYACRIKASGAGSYSYWNATTGALQSTVVWNPITTAPGGAFAVTLPNSAVPNGSAYNWSFASQNSLGAHQGAFATDSTFTAEVGPTVVVNSPAVTVTTPITLVAWTTTCASGSVQTYYRVAVYSQAQYTADGFTPGGGTPVWDSTKTAGSNQQAVTGPLPNGSTYRAYVLATETGDVDSAWSYIEFPVAYDTPAAPTLTATAGTQVSPAVGSYPAGVDPYPVAVLTIAGHDNLLTADDASFETSIGTWAAGANWTVTRDTTHSVDGIAALKCVRANATAGNGYAHNSPVPVTSGRTYTARVSIYADTTTAGLAYDLLVHDQSGGAIASATVTLGAAGTWTVASVQFTPAAGVTAAQLIVSDDPQTAPASGQSIWVDEAGIFPGTVTAWTRGGLAGVASGYVTYDDGTGTQVPVRTTINGVPLPAPDQTVTVVDAEVIPDTARTYRAYTAATI